MQNLIFYISVECFVDTCDPDEMTDTVNVTNLCKENVNVVELKENINKLEQCLQESDARQGIVCKDCLIAYNQLEGNFLQMEKNGVCFEAVDLVGFK